MPYCIVTCIALSSIRLSVSRRLFPMLRKEVYEEGYEKMRRENLSLYDICSLEYYKP